MIRLFFCVTWHIALSTAVVLSFAVQLGVSADNLRDNSAPVGSQFHDGQWPFYSPLRPTLPAVAGRESDVNPIDRFIFARLKQAGLQPSGEAGKAMLLRRVTYDLTGLLPTSAETDSFLADDSDEAFTRVADRLLASPRFGERWAQHWLDLVRYAETEGFKADVLRENAFHYRDYVIDSFNSDRPFNEFIRQQLAGDELEPDNPEAQVATGFLRLYPDEDNAANLFQRRQEILDDVTDTTGLVFLGLTMGCAQCHDHKFDDILQTDYYRLQAFFVSMTECNDVLLVSPSQVQAHQENEARWKEETALITSEISQLLRPVREDLDRFNLEKYEPAIVACYLKPASERTPFEEQIARMVQWRLDRAFKDDAIAKKLSRRDANRLKELEKQLAEFDSLKPTPLPTAMSVTDIGQLAPPTYLLFGGSWKRPEATVEPGFPEFLGAMAPEETALASIHRRIPTTGRRTQLAHWLTRPDHPLTARVIVNRLWQHHFGQGIVATPNDFGLQGERPTHPELLDWLAVELVESGWSLKHIHRLMVTSTTYRMTSLIDPDDANAMKAVARDPENKLLWRFNRRRLDGESIRDVMLQVSGELNLTMHGPSARPKLPAGIGERYAWQPDKDATQQNRRSVYVFAKRNMRLPLFEAFDQPDLHQSCARRAVTVTAPQSLAMLNSELTVELARSWAERLVAEHGNSPPDLIRAAYWSAYNRAATDEEVELAAAFLTDQKALGSPVAQGQLHVDVVADFCHALFNSNEFITLD
jgi:hypothetical protein